MNRKLGILAVAAMFVVGFAGFAMASPPVPPCPETGRIVTNTSIECVGTTTESQSYNNTYMAGAGSQLNPPMALGPEGSVAQIRYEQDLKAIDGYTRLEKSFVADSGEAPNLKVSKDVGFVGDPMSPIGKMDVSEKVAMTVISNQQEGFNGGGIPSLCPFANPGITLPPTNELIVAGSKATLKVGVLDTDSLVTTTASPVLQYSITGSGVGTISAGMIAQIQEGTGSTWDDDNDPLTPEVPTNDLQKTEKYTEMATASGLIANFHKDMSYTAIIPAVGLPEPWDMLGF